MNREEERSDLYLGGKELTRLRKERHAKWREENMAAIDAANIEYRSTNYGECLLFRVDGKPKADFYPSTGRWRSGGKTYRGGAKSFLRWFNNN